MNYKKMLHWRMTSSKVKSTRQDRASRMANEENRPITTIVDVVRTSANKVSRLLVNRRGARKKMSYDTTISAKQQSKLTSGARNEHSLAWAGGVLMVFLIPASTLNANGLGESRPWQFETPHEKSARAGVLDVIERKKGGYYDGFTTVVYTTTNVGTQINCNVTSSTNANIADNNQMGSSLTSAPQASNDADSTGSSTAVAGSAGNSSDVLNNDQQNSGPINSNVEGTNVSSSTSRTTFGATQQDLVNTQSNSGTLSSDIADSVACDMGTATLSGSVQSSVDGSPLGALN